MHVLDTVDVQNTTDLHRKGRVTSAAGLHDRFFTFWTPLVAVNAGLLSSIGTAAA